MKMDDLGIGVSGGRADIGSEGMIGLRRPSSGKEAAGAPKRILKVEEMASRAPGALNFCKDQQQQPPGNTLGSPATPRRRLIPSVDITTPSGTNRERIFAASVVQAYQAMKLRERDEANQSLMEENIWFSSENNKLAFKIQGLEEGLRRAEQASLVERTQARAEIEDLKLRLGIEAMKCQQLERMIQVRLAGSDQVNDGTGSPGQSLPKTEAAIVPLIKSEAKASSDHVPSDPPAEASTFRVDSVDDGCNGQKHAAGTVSCTTSSSGSSASEDGCSDPDEDSGSPSMDKDAQCIRKPLDAPASGPRKGQRWLKLSKRTCLSKNCMGHQSKPDQRTDFKARPMPDFKRFRPPSKPETRRPTIPVPFSFASAAGSSPSDEPSACLGRTCSRHDKDLLKKRSNPKIDK